MEGITGVLDRAKGEGLATLKVRSPCFLPPGKSSGSTAADPVALEEPQAGDPARHRARPTFAAARTAFLADAVAGRP
ncbi:hypothetical protein [Streptomyces sp. NPDC059278]